MKYTLLIVVLAMLSFGAQAHDPKEHAKEKAEAPDCAAMSKMDHGKMDMNDPVMKAMMTKCMKSMHDESTEEHGAKQGAAAEHDDDH